MGVVLAAAAIAIAFNVDQRLQTQLGGYSSALQAHVEDTGAARKQLRRLSGAGAAFAAPTAPRRRGRGSRPRGLGPAPAVKGISSWLNTPGDRPLTLAGLRGKVVLVDFWTYSCINCIRTLPHLRAWYAAYHRDGLEIVGVHTPEFAFEHVRSNVRAATRDLHVTWPVALDNDFKTWSAYSNQYWPAEYLIDRSGRVRRTHFGEGEYGETEDAIRKLLAQPGADARLERHPRRRHDARRGRSRRRRTSATTRLDLTRYAGDVRSRTASPATRSRAAAARRGLAAGRWKLTGQRAVAVRDARLRLHFHARNVYLVLGGRGAVDARAPRARRAARSDVAEDRLYTLVHGRTAARRGAGAAVQPRRDGLRVHLRLARRPFASQVVAEPFLRVSIVDGKLVLHGQRELPMHA